MPACPECGRALPAAGFCPHCLLKGGLEMPETETSAFQTTQAAPEIASEGLEPCLMGKYQLGAKLGEGGFGFVFEATQTQPIRREVAVKVLKAGMNASQVIARFEMERQALAMMNHPGIAQVLDAGETQDSRPFFVMERVHGVPVTQFVRQQQPSSVARLRLFVEICDAVHHAHTKGVIHRDLKPSNILVALADGVPHVKVIDFGLAKALDTRLTRRTIYTLHDQIIGTPGYISPEQAEHGPEAADVRGDVYALGALLYELLTGVPVVDPKSLSGKPLHEALREAAGKKLVPPSHHNPRLRGDLEHIILKALAPKPGERYASADALAQDILRHLADQPVQAHPASHVYLIRKFARRHHRGVAVAAAFVLAALAAIGAGVQHFMQQRRAQQIAALHQRELQRMQSRKDFQTARQLSERGRQSDAIASLCLALRTDPQNELAAAYLCSQLAHSQFGFRIATNLRVEDGWDKIIGVAANAARKMAVAVFQSTDVERHDLIARWDLRRSGKPQKLALPAGARISAFQTTLDDETLILGFSDGRLARYDIASGDFMPFETKMQGRITAIACAADSQHALVGTLEGEVRLWDVKTQQPVAPALALQGGVSQLALDAKAEHALISQNKTLVSIHPRTGQLAAVPFQVRQSGVTSITVNPQGTLAAVGLANGLVMTHRLPDLNPVGTPLALMGPASALNFNDAGNALAVGDTLGGVNVWRVPETRPIGAGIRLKGPVRLCRALSVRGHVLVIGGRGEIRLWHPGADTSISHHSRLLLSTTAASRDGSLVIMAEEKTPVFEVWEMQFRMIDPRPCATPPQSAGLVASLAQPGGPPLLLLLRGKERHFRAELGHRLDVTDAASSRPVCAPLFHEHTVRHAALTPDERTLLTITVDGTHRAWDAQTGEPLMAPHKCGERATTVRMHADGSRYAFQRENGEWFELPLPTRPGVLPDWFLDFAEARATKRLLPDGSTEVVRHQAQQEIVSRLPPSNDPATTLARWLMTAPKERAPWPDASDLTSTQTSTPPPAAR
ncbi:WD40 repeat domain-containing serine/threonine protein kinase [Prosthecobacter sp.]|uniref:WD40 repeat domain-containing serine/threonine protein kinase n=1 Tax=Prosthecobacter sp. TaxID=1965333 RepID=UPI002ABA93DC|nr:WD40 repeat domain-containing serine/threonine protein kinase [Prosthecobacter sp.]MDZ4401468.1 WD40 repeat domain-containing serine/threonine protein kinase [Prosthecobacter sp.]